MYISLTSPIFFEVRIQDHRLKTSVLLSKSFLDDFPQIEKAVSFLYLGNFYLIKQVWGVWQSDERDALKFIRAFRT